jgi:hypothetical protein
VVTAPPVFEVRLGLALLALTLERLPRAVVAIGGTEANDGTEEQEQEDDDDDAGDQQKAHENQSGP